MSRHINAFLGYEKKPHHHEDNLTRAFLIVLRGVPVAHAAWLDLVDRAHRANGGGGVPRLHELPAPMVDTQVGSVPGPVKRVISLVQTDEAVFKKQDLQASERQQRLDGIVVYDELALVIENKPSHRDIWDGQLQINVPDDVTHDPRAACVAWKDIVEAWGQLQEARHLGAAETVLLGDFLDYVEQHFPTLRPYSKVGLCGTEHDRLRRRCKALLVAVAGEEHVQYHRGWGWYISLEGTHQPARQLGLIVHGEGDDTTIDLDVCPGDTTSQGRAMFNKVALADVLALADTGWSLWTNFHYMHMQKILWWSHSTHSIADYWKLWEDHPEWLRQWKEPEFEEAWAVMLQSELAAPSDREAFEEKVLNTKRKKINFCPGIVLRRSWPVDEAALLDSRGTLEDELAEALNEVASALKLELPDLQKR